VFATDLHVQRFDAAPTVDGQFFFGVLRPPSERRKRKMFDEPTTFGLKADPGALPEFLEYPNYFPS
jgi:hypothetical protein